MFLLFWIVALVDILEYNVADAKIIWEVTTVPLLFDCYVEIQCKYHSNISGIDQISWTWNTGKGNDIILSHGFLSEKYKYDKKYSEKRSPNSHYSTLVISSFNESDYNKIYRCGIEYIDSAKSYFVEFVNDEITFRNIPYEYVPTSEVVSTEFKRKNRQKTFKLEIYKIYPMPLCNVTLLDKDITNITKVEKKKKGLFYDIVFTLYNSSVDQNVCIQCNNTRYSTFLYCLGDDRSKHLKSISGDVTAVLLELFSISFIVSSSVMIQLLYYSNEGQFNRRIKIQRFVDIAHLLVGVGGVILSKEHPLKVNEDGEEHPIQLTYLVKITRNVSFAILTICLIYIFVIISMTDNKLDRLTIKNNERMTLFCGLFTIVCISLIELPLLTKDSMLYRRFLNLTSNSENIFDSLDDYTFYHYLKGSCYLIFYASLKIYCVHLLHELNKRTSVIYQTLEEKFNNDLFARYKRKQPKKSPRDKLISSVRQRKSQKKEHSSGEAEGHEPTIEEKHDAEHSDSSEEEKEEEFDRTLLKHLFDESSDDGEISESQGLLRQETVYVKIENQNESQV